MPDAQGHFTGGRCRKGEYSREYLLFIADVLCSELGARAERLACLPAFFPRSLAAVVASFSGTWGGERLEPGVSVVGAGIGDQWGAVRG